MKHILYPLPSKKEMRLGFVYLALERLALPSLILLLFQDNLSVTRMNCLMFTVSFGVEVLIFRKFLMASLEVFLQNPGGTIFASLRGLGLYWLCSIPVNMVVLALDPSFANVNDGNVAAMVAQDFGLMAFCTILLVPVSEELLYRGLLFGGFYRRSPALAFALSTAAFSAIHVVSYLGLYPPTTLALCFLQYIPAGIALAWSWKRSGNIFSPILMHITINALGILSMR